MDAGKVREALRNWWRKQWRSPFYTDLRLVALKYRPLYEKQMREAYNPGEAIAWLRVAWDAGHFRCQQQARAHIAGE